jgi:hypothetical protein
VEFESRGGRMGEPSWDSPAVPGALLAFPATIGAEGKVSEGRHLWGSIQSRRRRHDSGGILARRCGRGDALAHPCASTTRRCCPSCRTRSRPRDLGEAGTWAPPSSAQSPTADSRSKTASSCPRTSRTHPPRARCRSCLEASMGASRRVGRARREAGGLAGVSAGRPCGGRSPEWVLRKYIFGPETRTNSRAVGQFG